MGAEKGRRLGLLLWDQSSEEGQYARIERGIPGRMRCSFEQGRLRQQCVPLRLRQTGYFLPDNADAPRTFRKGGIHRGGEWLPSGIGDPFGLGQRSLAPVLSLG
ncbi:hypothetical protein MTO96_033980 [Rhipicephalus appendiculatus]